MATELVSFGWKDNSVRWSRGSGILILDVRDYPGIGNPWRDPSLRRLLGTDPRVAHLIEAGPGFKKAYRALKRAVQTWHGPVWIGCTGGRHRSVYLADRLGRELGIPVVHLGEGRR